MDKNGLEMDKIDRKGQNRHSAKNIDQTRQTWTKIDKCGQ